MSAPLLQLENVAVHFGTSMGWLRAVDGVDLELGHGRTLGVVGESGCGKSVLSRTIMGLWPSNARIGQDSRILLEGRDLLAMKERDLRRLRGPRIGFGIVTCAPTKAAIATATAEPDNHPAGTPASVKAPPPSAASRSVSPTRRRRDRSRNFTSRV